MVGGDQLADGTACVVADQGDLLEVERGQEVSHQAREAGRGEVRRGVHRNPVRAERQIGDEAPEPTFEEGCDLAPQGAVHERSVDEDDRLAGPGVAIGDGSVVELDRAAVRLRVGHLVASDRGITIHRVCI